MTYLFVLCTGVCVKLCVIGQVVLPTCLFCVQVCVKLCVIGQVV